MWSRNQQSLTVPVLWFVFSTRSFRRDCLFISHHPIVMTDSRRPLCSTHDNTAIETSELQSPSPPKLFPIFLTRPEPGAGSRQPRPLKQRRTRSTGGDNGKVTTRTSDDDYTHESDRHPNRLSTYFAPSTPLRVGSGSCGRPAKLEVTASACLSSKPWRRPRKRLGFGPNKCQTGGTCRASGMSS